MEMILQRQAESCGTLFEVVRRRWAKAQAKRWVNGEAQTNDLIAHGIDVKYRTVMNWREGQLPNNRHKVELMAAGFSHMIEKAFEPAASAGRMAALEAEIEQQRAALRAHEAELETVRKAMAGLSDSLEG